MSFPKIEYLQNNYPEYKITPEMYELAKELYAVMRKSDTMEKWVYSHYFSIGSNHDTKAARYKIRVTESLKQAKWLLDV